MHDVRRGRRGCEPASWVGRALFLGFAALSAASYFGGIVVPYYANGLHLLPLDGFTTGAHDYDELWPKPTNPVSWFIGAAGFLTALFGQMFFPRVAWLSAYILVRDRHRLSREARLIYAAVIAIVVLTLAAMWSPQGRALLVWLLD